MEFVLCCLGGSFFCFGGGAPTCKMTPICKPTSTSKPTLPTNHPFLQDGWGTFASCLTQYKFKSSVFRMGGDALNYLFRPLHVAILHEHILDISVLGGFQAYVLGQDLLVFPGPTGSQVV